jgi:leader peptidase (prepilin peptidase) / N-methyltransferase
VTAPRADERPLFAGTRVFTLVGATAVAMAAIARYDDGSRGFVAAFAAFILVVLAGIDVERRRVPNIIVLPAAAATLAAQAAVDPGRWWIWAAAAFGGALVFFVFAVISPGGIGMGDVKLMLLIGAALGPAMLAGILVGTVSAAIAGLALIARHGQEGRRRSLPYVPFLAFGAIAALLLLRPR